MIEKQIRSEVDGRYARIDGDLIPLVSNFWLKDRLYANPFQPPLHDVTNPKDREFLVVLLQKGCVVLTDDIADFDADGRYRSPIRRGVLGLHSIENPAFSPANGLSFTLGPLIAYLTA